MTRNEGMIAGLDALSRTRALTDTESIRLEKLLRAEGLIPKTVRGVCLRGHPIEGDNILWHDGRKECRKRAYASRQQSQARTRAKVTA